MSIAAHQPTILLHPGRNGAHYRVYVKRDPIATLRQIKTVHADAARFRGYRTALRSQKRAAKVGEARAALGPRLRFPSQHRSKACLGFRHVPSFQ
jgi:outer membrane murein-binding lipoprotein Lpp